MYRIAVIQFPGTNCEQETLREVRRAGLHGELWRWNKRPEELAEWDGYILPGGFSYEDRIRAGAVAAHEKVMEAIRIQAGKGKPVLGICNGAQILVEAGMVPGPQGRVTAMLAANQRIVSGTGAAKGGYYNGWVWMRLAVDPRRCVFTCSIPRDFQIRIPVAHGEGRFLFLEEEEELISALQLGVFQYCREDGTEAAAFPENPNGSFRALAGVCNKEGNVLAVMPHPERTPDGRALFLSLRRYMEGEKVIPVSLSGAQREKRVEKRPVHEELHDLLHRRAPDEEIATVGGFVEPYVPQDPLESVDIFVELLITDNTTETLLSLFARNGIERVKVRRLVHWEIVLKEGERESQEAVFGIILALIKSDVLMNVRKEIPLVRIGDTWYDYGDAGLIRCEKAPRSLSHPLPSTFLVRDRTNAEGELAKRTLENRLRFYAVKSIRHGVVWQFSGEERNRARDFAFQHSLLANPIGQDIYSFSL